MIKYIKNMRGDGGLFVILIIAFTLVFVVIPVWSYIVEKHLINIKAQEMIDAIDEANYAVYHTLNLQNTSKTVMAFHSELETTYKSILADNLKLNANMTPKAYSIAEGTVTVESLVAYSSGFPVTCPNGKTISRPTVHSVINIPIKPALYREVILNALGKTHIDIVIHRDTEIPVNK